MANGEADMLGGQCWQKRWWRGRGGKALDVCCITASYRVVWGPENSGRNLGWVPVCVEGSTGTSAARPKLLRRQENFQVDLG